MRTFCVNLADRLTWHQDGEDRGSKHELWVQHQNGRNSAAASHPELTRAGTVTAALYHSLCTEIKRTKGQVTTVCGPRVQQKAGQINAYLTSSETVKKRTAPSQITRVSADRENNNSIYRRRKIRPSVERQEQNTTERPQIFFACRLGGGERHDSLLIERIMKLKQQNHSLSNSIHWESNRDITEENMSLQFAVSTENSLCAERDGAMGEWVADWIKNQTFSALVPYPIWVPPWFTSASLSWKKNLADRSTIARGPAQSSLGLEGETSQFVTNRSLGVTYGKRNWWVTLICVKGNIELRKTNGVIVV